jgi:hypothetical protein
MTDSRVPGLPALEREAAVARVPFHCQWDLVPEDLPARYRDRNLPWHRAGCAIACATMVLNHYDIPVSMATVLCEALAMDAFDEVRFWRHAQLVGLLRNRGLDACRRNWRLLRGHEGEYLGGRAPTRDARAEIDWVERQMLAEGLWTIRGHLDRRQPCIVSTYRPSGNVAGPGHQLVLVGYQESRLWYHDPAEPSGAGLSMSMREFLADWKGTAILAQPRDDTNVNPTGPEPAS